MAELDLEERVGDAQLVAGAAHVHVQWEEVCNQRDFTHLRHLLSRRDSYFSQTALDTFQQQPMNSDVCKSRLLRTMPVLKA